MSGYIPTIWNDGEAPAISAANLNKLETEGEHALGVDTIYDLRDLPVPTFALRCWVRGHTDVLDGGGGVFDWNATCPDADDNGMIILPDNYTGIGRWVRSINDISINAAWWGLVDDLVMGTWVGTDNTSAIQSAINFASFNNFMFVQLPVGKFRYSNIYLHYDASLNPGFNPDKYEQGRIVLRGSGRDTHRGFLGNDVKGTLLYSDSNIGVASIHCDGGSQFDGQQTRLEFMNLISNNSTKIVEFDGTPQESGLTSIMFEQLGTGGGVTQKNGWFNRNTDITGNGAGKDNSIGIGWHIYNSDSSGGFITDSSIGINAFSTGVAYGTTNPDDPASRLHGIRGMNVQGGDANVGVIFGGGLNSSNFEIHAEANDLGVKIINHCSRIRIRMSTSGNEKDLEVGSSQSNENEYSGITLYNCEFLSKSAPVLVEVFSGPDTDSLSFELARFSGDGSSGQIGLKLQDLFHHNLTVSRLNFGSIETDIDKPEYIKIKNDANSVINSTNTVDGNNSSNFLYIQRNKGTSTASPLGLYQQNNASPMLRMQSDNSPTISENAVVTKLNGDGGVVGPQAKDSDPGWDFSYMVRVQLETADGIENLYMPLYKVSS
jgi:hypothetical protein